MNINNILKNIYNGFIAIFEFIIDISITLIIIYILNQLFEKHLIITILSYIILISGITYGINDIIEIYRNNKNGKQ